MSEIIRRAAAALGTDDRVIASALTAYQTQTGMTEPDIAAWLGLSVPRLHVLALCSKPAPSDPAYAEAVAATAEYVGCHSERMLWLLNRAFMSEHD